MFWKKEAQIKNISDHIKQIQAVRVGGAEPNDYARCMQELQAQLETFKIGREDATRQNWEDLKALKKISRR